MPDILLVQRHTCTKQATHADDDAPRNNAAAAFGLKYMDAVLEN